MTTMGQEGRPRPTGTVRVEHRAARLALVVVAVLLGSCATPTGGGSPGTGSGSVTTAISSLAPSASVASATPSSSPVPSVEAAIGQPADDGARITGCSFTRQFLCLLAKGFQRRTSRKFRCAHGNLLS